MASKTDNLYAIARGNVNGKTLYVTVGDNGTILTAAESGTGLGGWTLAMSNTAENLRGIVFTEGKDNKFYAVGDNGALVTSVDGKTWTASTLKGASSPNFGSIAYNNEWLLAHSFTDSGIANNGNSFISQDGLTWTELMNSEFFVPGAAAIANRLTSGRFVLAQGDQIQNIKLDVSKTSDPSGDYDPLDRNVAGLGDDEYFYGLATDEKGRYIAVGDNFNISMTTEDDLLYWKHVDLGIVVRARKLNAVAMSGEHFIAVGALGAVLQSTDGGKSWEIARVSEINDLRGVVSTGLIGQNDTRVFIVVGDNGYTKAIEV